MIKLVPRINVLVNDQFRKYLEMDFSAGSCKSNPQEFELQNPLLLSTA